MSNYCKDIFDYIKQQEISYQKPIRINDSWEWSMKEHIKTTENYTNSQLNNGKTQFTPVKNITKPILNLQHRAEDIELADVQLYIDDPAKFHLSLLVKKYHDDKFVIDNDLDTFFDDLNVSRIDLGAGLSKKLKAPAPMVVPLQSIVFCNQKDILASPFGLLHEYGVEDLLAMEEYGWGQEANGATHSIQELITLWREEEVPSEGIKIYEVHGNFPKRFADYREVDTENEVYETRMFICAFYQPKGATEKQGIILYTATEKLTDVFKLIKRDPVYGRALGFGGAEELFEAQVWTNYDMIRMQNMLDAAAITILKSSDPTVLAKNPKGLKNMKNLEIVDVAPNADLSQVDTFPRNMRLFETSVASWDEHAKYIGASQDPLQGVAPTAGTPFASLQAQIQQGMGLHDYRRKQFAKHIEEIYYDWIIPHIVKEITKGTEFLSELSQDELNFVVEKVSVVEWNKYATEKILSGGTFEEGEQEQWMTNFKEEFKKGGTKRFISILKDEFKGIRVGVKVSVAGKSKNLGAMADKITKIFQFIFANPQGFAQVMQVPGMAKSFNDLLEYSGMTPADFQGIDKMAIAQPEQPQQPVTA